MTKITRSIRTGGAARRGATTAVLVLASMLAGCGAETDDREPEPTSESESAAPGVVCAEVWVADETLPRPYDGCWDVDPGADVDPEAEPDSWVAAESFRCSSGQRIVIHDDSFYAVPGQKITQVGGSLADDSEWARVLEVCTA